MICISPLFVTHSNQIYSPKTTRCYQREITIYLEHEKAAQTANYQSLILYLNELRKTKTTSSIQGHLQGIKVYYNYLIAKDIRENNPAKFILLKDRKSCEPAVGHRLLSEEDLERLWQYFLNRKKPCKIVKNRDISMTGLLLKQAIRKSELEALTIEDLDLEKSQIYIPQTPKSQARTLALESSQILPFYRYLNEDRPRLLQDKPPTNSLFITRIGTIDKCGAMRHVIKKSKSLIKNKEINPNTIRMSVIARQFRRGHALQEVQYFAGHATPTATERYKINHLEALQESITKHHPLK